MNASRTAVICDSGCDVSRQTAEKYGITILNLIVNYHDRSIKDLDLLDEDPHYVYKHFEEEIPTTSGINEQMVWDEVERLMEEGYRNFITVSISSRMSGTYNAVHHAMEEVSEEHPECKTYAFDSKNISIGAGVFAIWAGYMLQQGASFEEVTKGLERKIYDSDLEFYMDSLYYLRKGGRITPAVEIAGRILNIKPIIACNHEGVYYTVVKVRGRSRGVEKLINGILKKDINPETDWFMIMNGDAENLAEKARAMLLEKYPNAKIIEDHQIAPTMAINTGPGLLGFCWFSMK